MGYFVPFTGYRPAARPDLKKWTSVGIYEAPNVSGVPGAWSQIDAQPLPDYPDPMAPPSFDLDTTEATATSGLWYRIQFRDSFGGLQESAPEYNGVTAVPDVVWVRETSNADWDEMGYPDPGIGYPDRLQDVLDEAAIGFQAITSIDPYAFSETDKRLPLVRQAIRMLVEYQAASSTMEHLGTASDYDMLSGMSASDYSETRRGMWRSNGVLHPWPALARLLAAIMYFDSQGQPVQEGPSVSRALKPRPYEEIMESLLGPTYPRGVGSFEPLWPQPWVTNTNGTP